MEELGLDKRFGVGIFGFGTFLSGKDILSCNELSFVTLQFPFGSSVIGSKLPVPCIAFRWVGKVLWSQL